MGRIRLRLSKTDTAKYISHLDLMSLMSRALQRAGVKLKFSEGFNPHPYLSVALPLPVGCGSICELLDFDAELDPPFEGLPDQINDVLPGGVRILEAYAPERKFNEITWIGMECLLYYSGGVGINITEMLKERFSAESIIVSKRTKRGISDIDIIPFIRDIDITGDDVVNLSAKVTAQNPSINPENILDAIERGNTGLAPDLVSFKRMEVFDGNMDVFR